MENFQVVRVKGRDATLFTGGLGRHNRGEQRPPQARPRPPLDPVSVLFEDRAGGEILLQRMAAAPKKRGKPPQPGVELVIAGPPPYESEAAWPQERVQAWSASVLDWLQASLADPRGEPVATLVEVHLHQDETSPNIHASLIPATLDRPRPAKKEFEYVLAGGRILDHRKRISAVQDRHQELVGRHFDLGRGVKGSGTRHAPTDVAKGLEARARGAEAREQAKDEENAALRAENEAAAEREREARRIAEEAQRRAVQAESDRAARDLAAERAEKAKRQGRGAAAPGSEPPAPASLDPAKRRRG